VTDDTVIVMWRVRSCDRIERVECSKVTAKCVFLVAEPDWRNKIYRFKEPQRESMSSFYRSYHKTWAEAHQALLARVEAEVASARRQLERLNGDYGRIKGMKSPEGES
jgi:hypothetical protein